MAYRYDKEEIKGKVNSLESFGLVDGPGVRFVVFMQGCAFRCKYCHNPETWGRGGSDWTAHQLFDKVYRFKSYWRNNGGVTVSGGEPLLQMDFLIEFFTLLKAKGVHSVIDTAGQPFSKESEWLSRFEKLMSLTDLVILDLKEWDREKHKALTGMYNDNVKELAVWLSDNGKDMWIRHVLVPGLTDSENDLRAMGEFIAGLKTVRKTEVLPYHAFGVPKWEKLGLEYELADAVSPDEKQISCAEFLLGITNK